MRKSKREIVIHGHPRQSKLIIQNGHTHTRTNVV